MRRWCARIVHFRQGEALQCSASARLVWIATACVLGWGVASAAVAREHAHTASATPSYSLHGRVVKVHDGDTFTLLANGHRQRIRMASIDAPELAQTSRGRKGQPHARAAATALRAMLADRTLTLACFETDPFGRHVCDAPLAHPIDGARTANQRMVALGMAWANRQQTRFLRDPGLTAIEARARADKRGLWKGRTPVAPWVWREQCWRRKQCG